MMEHAVFYFVTAYLGCWAIDLIMVVARGPVVIDPILKLVVVLLCLLFLLVRAGGAPWVLRG